MTEETKKVLHDPDSILDYGWDWAKWLAAGDTISAAVCSITTNFQPGEITLNPAPHADAHTNTTATCWVSGGKVGRIYRLTCRITTSAGRTDQRTILLDCKER